MESVQSVTPEAVNEALGISGYAGITAAADGTTASTLDVTVAATAWALLADGTLLGAPDEHLASTTIPGNTVAGTYTLWLDDTWGNNDDIPAWSVAAVAPSTRALAVATVTVAAGVISAVVMNPQGVANYPLAGAFATTAPAAGAGAALPATPAGYVTLLINGVARKVAVY